MAASSVQALEASSEALMPFVVHTLAALVGGLIIVRIWQKMPAMNQKETLEKQASSM
jgi:spore maturation protein SpmA